MGYSHYWTRPPRLPPVEFAVAVADCRKLLPQLGVPLAGPGGTGPPECDVDRIVFNGVGTEGREAFAISQHEPPRRPSPQIFSYCKTARRPYDLAVQCALIILKRHLGDRLTVTSDGPEGEWELARAACQQHLSYGQDFRLGPRAAP